MQVSKRNVLGLRSWRAIEERYAYGQLRALLAVLSEVAESIANADDPEAARRARDEGSALLERVLDALRAA